MTPAGQMNGDHQPLRYPRWGASVLVTTHRPAILAFAAAIASASSPPLAVVELDSIAEAAEDGRSWTDMVTTLVDLDLPFGQIVRAVRLSRQRALNSRVIGVACCHSLLTTALFEKLLREPVDGVISLEASPDEALAQLRALAERTDSVSVHTRIRRLSGQAGRDLQPADRMLVHLVAQGMSDSRIAVLLHRNPHTVKHQIERLRSAVQVRNRTELAAWAGLNGYYSGDERADIA
jgi:DNA-binding NarL/FixJ family response regulator